MDASRARQSSQGKGRRRAAALGIAAAAVIGLVLSGLLLADRRDRPSLSGTLAALPARPGAQFGLRDSGGASMDSLKVVGVPSGGYFGVYHYRQGQEFCVAVATSFDLTTWSRRTVLDCHASQATAMLVEGGAVLVAEEADNNGLASPSATWVRVRHYAGLSSLFSGRADRSIDLPHSLVPPVRQGGAEGTPNFYRAVIPDGDLNRSIIELGLHYFDGGVSDREARGVLQAFRSWQAEPDVGLEQAAMKTAPDLASAGARDAFEVNGKRFLVVELQLRPKDQSSWRVALWQTGDDRVSILPIRTPGGSRSFANPRVSILAGPAANPPVLLMTVFLPQEGAGPREAGELLVHAPLSQVMG